MAFLLEEAFQETKNHYQLELLAGREGLATSVSWVYQLEETTIISHFWGKELAVTMGLGFQTTEALIGLVDELKAHDAAGLFINIGPYLNEIDKEVIKHCDELKFPLITVPWEIILADLIKDYCIRVFRDENEEKDLVKAVIGAIEAPTAYENYQTALSKHFNTQGSFQIALLVTEKTETLISIQKRRLLFQLKKVFDDLTLPYLAFWYQDSYVLLVNDMEEKLLLEQLHKIDEHAKNQEPDTILFIGYGTPVQHVTQLRHAYKRAHAALYMAKMKNQSLYSFQDMGIYQLLLSIDDSALLQDMYLKVLSPLRNYDEEHNTNYEDTLYYYLRYNGSIQAIAEATYTHRNTVLYRIKKVKELLGKDLEDTEERFPYQMAFYIKKIMQP